MQYLTALVLFGLLAVSVAIPTTASVEETKSDVIVEQQAADVAQTEASDRIDTEQTADLPAESDPEPLAEGPRASRQMNLDGLVKSGPRSHRGYINYDNDYSYGYYSGSDEKNQIPFICYPLYQPYPHYGYGHKGHKSY